jgi:hypothetical protein
MPLNEVQLFGMLYNTFKRQSVKPGPGKVEVNQELAMDMTKAISAYVRGGTVLTSVTSFGVGATAPHPIPYPVFTVALGTGVGFVT